MNPFAVVPVAARHVKRQAIRRILSLRIQARHPSPNSDSTAIWDCGCDDIDAIDIGRSVSVLAFVETSVHKRNRYTPYESRLILGDGATLAVGANVRAAGGVISIGARSGIGQYSVLLAANHAVKLGVNYFNTPYDESRSGLTIGTNVWVGPQCAILPGVIIGDGALIAAGSLVNRRGPENQVWAGSCCAVRPQDHLMPRHLDITMSGSTLAR